MTQRIPLAKGRGFALVDDADADLVAGYSWYLHRSRRDLVYARAYVKGSGRANPRYVYMHQLITGQRGTDHANGNGLDNQRHNLRDATRGQQQVNRPSRWGRSKYRGVWLAPDRTVNPWRAEIRKDGRVRRLGTFADEETAARAYDQAAREIWGEFASLNFPLS